MRAMPVTIVTLTELPEMMMIKRIIIYFWIIFGFFLSPHDSFAQKNPGIKVKYISAENVYLDAGSVYGLAIGDTLKITRNGATIGKILVKYVSEYSASCQIIFTNTIN